MIEVFLEKEGELKSSAESAAAAGDWGRVEQAARGLISLYGAILASGLADKSTTPRWETLRERWREIAAQAAEKSKAGQNGIADAAPGKAQDIRRSVDVGVSIPDGEATETQRKGSGRGDGQGVKSSQTLRLSDVKGLSDAKQAVMDALVNPVLHPEIYKVLKMKTGKGLLLYGPPGTGKTMFARAIAGELGIPFIYKKVSELKDKYVGESEKSIARLFEEAYSHKKCLIFLDECEGILRRRGNQKICLVEAFLAELDGFATNRDAQVFTLLATNRPWLIDSAVMRSGRISTAVHVGLPDEEARKFIVLAALEGLPIADDVDVDEIVRRTEGFSGAELHHADGGGVCDEMKQFAHRRWEAARRGLPPDNPAWKDTRDVSITRDDFERALKKVIPVSVSDPEIVRKNKEFSFGRSSAPGGEDED